MAIREALCENCKKKIYCVADFGWYHIASRRWYCGDRDWSAEAPRTGARPIESTIMARKGSNA